ncbi:N-acetylmannosamine kinase [Propionigenium maris DSM 9537]|uniref:N-acetylmannosamine kinase n=1 Tax=Propionigenium maris DSM 9537 TaxID=1123000 RepID=A0A9W6LM61_9FUSO|nr:MurR/RpiR family transcriptional regulator [Propionigenium maris]GLI55337.1 N-acetylmannosamine kinase [Propionigenium maris DSM 9537]
MREELNKKIASSLSKMTEKEKQVAKFFLEELESISIYTVDQISERLNVSKATVVRTTKKIGFKGYLDFRREATSCFSEKLTTNKKIINTMDRIDSDPYLSIIQEDLNRLLEFRETWSNNLMEKVTASLNNANKIYLIGYGVSEALVIFMKFRLERFGKEVKVINKSGKYFASELMSLKKEDLIFVFGFHNPAKELTVALKYGRNIGATTLAMTNDYTSPLAEHAQYVIPAKRGDIETLNSLSLPMVLCHAITLGLLKKRRDEMYQMTGKLEEILNLF